jgi:predicted amidohydrolase
MVINPWGLVVAQAPDRVAHLTADIDLDYLDKVRASFPSLDHRREDIFNF